MGKPATRVARGDERVGEGGLLNRVVDRLVEGDRVQIAFNEIRPSGGVRLRFEDWDRDSDTTFSTPAAHVDDDDVPA